MTNRETDVAASATDLPMETSVHTDTAGLYSWPPKSHDSFGSTQGLYVIRNCSVIYNRSVNLLIINNFLWLPGNYGL